MDENEGAKSIRNSEGLTGHLQKLKIEMTDRQERWINGEMIKRRLEDLATKSARKKTDSGRETVKKEAYAYVRKKVTKESERRKYREYFKTSVVAFLRAKEKGFQSQDPFGIVPFYMRD